MAVWKPRCSASWLGLVGLVDCEWLGELCGDGELLGLRGDWRGDCWGESWGCSSWLGEGWDGWSLFGDVWLLVILWRWLWLLSVGRRRRRWVRRRGWW